MDEFLNRIKTQKSINTWKTYSRELVKFEKVNSSGDLLDLIQGWKLQGLAKNTIKLRLSVLGEYLKYKKSNPEMQDICHEFRGENKIVSAPDESKVDNLIDSIHNYKYKAILLLMAHSGLRVQEICNLGICDYNPLDKRIILRSTKNGDDGIVFISDKAKEVLDLYISKYRKNTSSCLFTTSNGKCTTRPIQVFMEKHNMNCHGLRHYFCQTLIDNSVNLPVVQKAMRHKNLSSTQRYFEISAQQVQDAVRNIFD